MSYVKISESRRKGPVRRERCLEPIAHCLIRTLVVPKIFFQRTWASVVGLVKKPPVDVLAIDRAGTGDVHAVVVRLTLREALTRGVETVNQVPAHYRWVAYQGRGLFPEDDKAELLLLSETPLLPASGMGRIGVIEVVSMVDLNLGANIRLRAERFPTEDLDKMVANFVRREKADIEFKG